MLRSRTAIVALLLSGFATAALGQWQPDQRLTDDPAASTTAENNAWCVAAAGDTVHAVWYDERDDSAGEIYYKRSIDGGATWGSDTRLTSNPSTSALPSVAAAGAAVHVVWWDGRDGNYEIYYKRSIDGGATWGNDTRLTNNASPSVLSSVAAAGAAVHVVWCDSRDGNTEIYYKCSTDGGATWGSDTRLTNNAGDSRYSSVAVAGAAVHVVWFDDRDGNCEIYYKRSTDGGATWGSDTRLTNVADWSETPSVAVSGAALHVVWEEYRDGNWEIYYKRSTDGGATWGSDARLTNNAGDSRLPSVAVAGAAVHVVWQDNRDGNFEVYHKRSTTAGATWSSDTRLTDDDGGSVRPSVAVAGAAAHVVWFDDRDGNTEIYYKHDPTGNPAPTVTVTAPNGGEVWAVGSTRNINWTHGGGLATRDSIWYSTNNGSNWSFVAEKFPAATTHSWVLPNPPTTQALVRVKAVNQFGSTADQSDATFTIGTTGQPGWYSKSPMPTGAKAIKDGGWLAYDASKARVYASRGNRSYDFFAYAPDGDSWKPLAPWPPGAEGRSPGKGSVGCADGNGIIYATKGNNKLGFHKYDANANVWTQKSDVPLGLSNKRVKGGTDIVWAYKGSVGSPYLLKGYKNEFYRYDVDRDSWKTLSPAPVGANVKWDKGSWLAYDELNKKIYAHKAKYHEFYSYNIEKDSWSAALTAMPIPGSAGSKKAKDGSCGAYTGGSIYALKGGGTWEFWKYTIASNSWAEKEQIPLGVNKKKVKAGADIVTAVYVLYATKGNKTDELWMYVPGSLAGSPFTASSPAVQASGVTRDASGVMRLLPSPLTSGFVTLSFAGALDRLSTGPLSIAIFDASGRLVRSVAIRQSPFTNRIDLWSMPAGVYLVKLTRGDLTATQKLVVQR